MSRHVGQQSIGQQIKKQLFTPQSYEHDVIGAWHTIQEQYSIQTATALEPRVTEVHVRAGLRGTARP